MTTSLPVVSGVLAMLFLQSSLVLAAGLLLARAVSRAGALAESSVLRVAVIAVVLCPLATAALRAADVANPWMSVYRGMQASALQQPPAPALRGTPPAPPARGVTAVASPATADVKSLWSVSLLVSLAWAAICGGLLARLARGIFRVEVLRAAATPAPGGTARFCEGIAKAMGIAPPAVFSCAAVKSPCVIGIRNPLVLLPPENNARAGQALQCVLIHELAHIARRDCLWMVLGRVLSALFFFQPLLFAALRRLESLSDDIADDYVVKWGGGRADYAGQLVDLAQRNSRLPAGYVCAGTLPFASALGRRVQRILDEARPIRLALGRGAWCALFSGGMAVTLVAASMGCVPASGNSQAGNVQQDKEEKERVIPEAQAPEFVDDPDVIGVWESVSFVKQIEDFKPQSPPNLTLYWKGIEIMPGGRTSGPWVWSKGILHHPGDRTNAAYTIKKMNDATYLFVEWMSGDVTFRGMTPQYYVLKLTGPSNAKPIDLGLVDPRKYLSETPPAFVSDPAVLGKWEVVDFVRDSGDFQPGIKKWTGDLDFLQAFDFQPQGKLVKKVAGKPYGDDLWSQGVIWSPHGNTLSKYIIKEIDGNRFMFFEWVSGDVTIRHQSPWYYVFQFQP